MKILISEDTDEKYREIENCLKTILKDVEIKRVKYAKASVIELINNEYDILIQDMQLPLNIDSRIDIKGGEYVFNQLERRNIKIKFIFCSSDEVNFYKENNEEEYVNKPVSIKFDYVYSNWRQQLIKEIVKE